MNQNPLQVTITPEELFYLVAGASTTLDDLLEDNPQNLLSPYYKSLSDAVTAGTKLLEAIASTGHDFSSVLKD